MNNQHLKVERLSPAIGGEVHGLQLSQVERPEVVEELKKALWEHKVLFLRDQELTPEQYVRIGRIFGDVERHEYLPTLDGHAEIQILASKGDKSPDTDYWHSDVTFRKRPSLVHMLHADKLPDCGGDTLWASMSAAFEALPKSMKEYLLTLSATHDMAYFFRRSGYLENQRSEADETDLYRKNPPQHHPVVVQHPHSKERILFVNSVWTKKIDDVDLKISDGLLKMLFEWVQKPEFQVRFRWRPGSFVLWDNLATQHYAVFDYAGKSRRMHRMQAGSVEPVAASAQARGQAA